MKLKQILGWAVVAFIAVWLVSNPDSAGHLVHTTLGGVKATGNDLANWFNSI